MRTKTINAEKGNYTMKAENASKTTIVVWIVDNALWLFGLLAVFILATLTIFLSPYMNPDVSEQTFWNKDVVIATVVTPIILISCPVCIALLKKPQHTKTAGEKRAFFKKPQADWLLFGIFFLYGLVWALVIQDTPTRDQAILLHNAQLFSQGDFSACALGGYLDVYPFQIGLVWFCVPFGMLFGFQNFIWFGILNALAFGLIYKSLFWFAGRICKGSWLFWALLFFGILFFPLVLYVGFYYGTLLGLATGLLACKNVVRFFTENNLIKNAIFACIFSALTVFFKSNNQIIIIAIVIISICLICKKQTYKLLALPLCVILSVWGLNVLTLSSTRAVSGYALDQGGSSLTWILTGLSESEKGPGWYNDNYSAFNLVSKEDAYTERESKQALQLLQDRILWLSQNPEYTGRFIVDKLSSQWSNPDFQGWWNVRFDKLLTGSPFGALEGKVQEFFDSDAYYVLGRAILLFVYLYTITGLLLKRKKLVARPELLLLLLVFLGGFLCFTFWEAKGQYVLPFFVCLVPYAFMGLQQSIWKIREMRDKALQKK